MFKNYSLHTTITIHAGSNSWQEGLSETVNSRKIFRHPNYDNPSRALQNGSEHSTIKNRHDIALVKLKQPFPPFLNDSIHYRINTVCLPKATQTYSAHFQTVYAFGFGRLGKRQPAFRLQAVERLLMTPFCDEYMLCAFTRSPIEPKMCTVS